MCRTQLTAAGDYTLTANVTIFLANLRHDIRNNQTVEVGSGLFKGQELVDVAKALGMTAELLAALRDIANYDSSTHAESAEKVLDENAKIARAAIAKAELL